MKTATATLEVTVTGDRGAEWQRVLGHTPTLPVRSARPVRVKISGRAPQSAYLVDLDRIPIEDLDALLGHLAAKYGMDREIVSDRVLSDGLPILAAECQEHFEPRDPVAPVNARRFLFV